MSESIIVSRDHSETACRFSEDSSRKGTQIISEFVEVRSCRLTGVALDWATFCAAYGMQPTIHVVESETRKIRGVLKPVKFPRVVSLTYRGGYGLEYSWNPSSDWSHGGPLITKYLMDFTIEHPHTIGAALCDENGMYIDDRMFFGETHLIAACRALVAHKLGDTVSVPKELFV